MFAEEKQPRKPQLWPGGLRDPPTSLHRPLLIYPATDLEQRTLARGSALELSSPVKGG